MKKEGAKRSLFNICNNIVAHHLCMQDCTQYERLIGAQLT
ncbi:hypothetical protein HMPREF3190_01110 [Umbribacter vaginalis]|nr:hypothetical protein HMPREF3190_01110 [Coriobacteriales bacterium DNF00809]